MRRAIRACTLILVMALGLGGIPRAYAGTVLVQSILEGRSTDATSAGDLVLLVVGKGLKSVDFLHLEPATGFEGLLPTVDLRSPHLSGSNLALFADTEGELLPGEYELTLFLKSGLTQGPWTIKLAAGGIVPGATIPSDSFDAYANLNANTRIGSGASQVARGSHNHDTDYPKKTDLAANDGLPDEATDPVHWSKLKGIPADLKDGDAVGTAGEGLSLAGTTFSVAFAGTGVATTAARSDHTHNYADSTHNHDTSYYTKSQLNASGGTLNAAANPVDWSQLKGVPAGFADGTDADTTYTAGTGITLSTGAFSVAFAGTGSASTAARSDHDHDSRYFTQSQLSGTTGVLNALTNPLDWSQLKSVPAGFADGTDNDTTYTAGTGIVLASGAFSVDFAGSGSAGTSARSDHNHDGAYAAIVHNHDTRYYTQAQLNSTTGTVNGSTNPLDWSQLKSVPAGFADGTDDSVTFAGNGAATTASRSDHDHDSRYYLQTQLNAVGGTLNDAANPVDWTRLKGIPSSIADGVDDTITLAGTGTASTGAHSDHNHNLAYSDIGHDHAGVYSAFNHNHDTRYPLATALSNASGTVNFSGNPLDWTQLKSVPAGFADGTDDTVTFAGSGSANTASRSDHLHTGAYLTLTGGAISSTASTGNVLSVSGSTMGQGIEVTNLGIAVRGTTGYAGSAGVWGIATNGYGIYGTDGANSGSSEGVHGESASSSGIGVRGSATKTFGTTYGVYGSSSSSTGTGVYGSGSTGVYGASTNGTGTGVYGASSQGYGVFGSATDGSTYNSGHGVHGVAAGASSGVGLYGEATSTAGSSFGPFGVYGKANNTGGFGGYFTNAGTALAADNTGTSGNIAEFKSAGSTVAIIDKTGKATFNGGITGIATSSELSTPGTINTATNPVDWTKLKGVPAGFADGTDDTVVFAGTGSAATAARSDHNHDATYLKLAGGTMTGALSVNLATGGGVSAVYATNTGGGAGDPVVFGNNTGTTGGAIGTRGDSYSGSGYGVYGYNASSGNGVYGASVSGTGVRGTGGTGVHGTGDPGVLGTSTNYGVRGDASAGRGVHGTGAYAGVSGELSVDGGSAGVRGDHTHATGNASGVLGTSSSTAGKGVFAIASGSGGIALVADHTGASGNVAEFRSSSSAVATIDKTGKATFNGGITGYSTTTSADSSYVNSAGDSMTGPLSVSTSTSSTSAISSTSSGGNTCYGVYASAPNTTTGAGVYGQGGAYGVRGTGTTGVDGLATGNATIGVKGTSPGTAGFGVYGTSTGSAGGTGVYGDATNTSGTSYGLYGLSASASGTGAYAEAQATTGTTYGVYGKANSTSGYAGYFTNVGTGLYAEATNTTGTQYGVYGKSASSSGYAGYFENTRTSGTTYGVYAKANSGTGYGLYADNAQTTGTAYGAYCKSASSGGIGVMGECPSSGTGIFAQAGGGSGGGNAFIANLTAASSSSSTQSADNPAIFQFGGSNVARIDMAGKGYFNGGTATSGADFAESVAVNAPREGFEPGDVIAIDPAGDRRFALSGEAESTLVAGVYSTKPGMLATLNSVAGSTEWQEKEIPLAVIGIVPTKVCDEGGAIRAGDLLVTASIPGHAKKAPANPKAGTVLGKALGSMSGKAGVVEVLLGPAR